MQNSRIAFTSIFFLAIFFNSKIHAQKLELNLGGVYGYNIGLVSNGRNTGSWVSNNMYSDDNYHMYSTTDPFIGLSYQLSTNNYIGIEYKNYQLRQIYYDYTELIRLDISQRVHSAGAFFKHYWSDKKISLYNRFGVHLIFDSNKEKIKFTSDIPWESEASYTRLVNFKSYSVINYIFNTTLGLRYKVNPKLSLEGFLDLNLGIRNLYTNLIVIENGHMVSSPIGNVTGMNKGDKVGFGLQVNYVLFEK